MREDGEGEMFGRRSANCCCWCTCGRLLTSKLNVDDEEASAPCCCVVTGDK